MAFDPATRTERPLPERIARQLRAEIDRGTYPAGVYLPSEKTLAETFGVAVNMLRQGLSILGAEGWVTPVNGKGTLVLDRPTPAHTITLDPHDPWRGLSPIDEPHRHRQAAHTRTAALLGIEPREPLACVDQTAIHAETGVLVRTARALPFASYDGMTRYPDPFEDRAAIINALREHCGPLRTALRISASIPATDDREGLGLGLGAVLLQAHWITKASDGRGLLLETARVAAQNAEFAITHD